METNDDIELFVRSKKKLKTREEEPTSANPPKSTTTTTQESKLSSLVSPVSPVSAVSPSMSWSDLKVCKWLQNSCRQHGLGYPTPIQQQCVIPLMEGKDVIASAPTGSGKTAAFAVPMLQKLSEDPFGIFGLVLTPTRELAIQIAEQFNALGAPIHVKVEVVIGGKDILTQRLALTNRPHIVIATLGRLLDHLNTGANIDFSRLKYLVLDEADRLLTNDGLKETLSGFLESISLQNCQKLLFSATMNITEQDMSSLQLREPVKCSVGATFSTVDTLRQEYLLVPAAVKDCYLVYLLRSEESEKPEETTSEDVKREKKPQPKKGSNKRAKKDETNLTQISIIVFTSSCRDAQVLSMLLRDLGIRVVPLHSGLSQFHRTKSLDAFRSGYAKVLIATDVASRGLDIPTVELVINYDLPKETEDYIHRVGRTARAGRNGKAVTMVTQYDVEQVQTIESAIGKQLQELTLREAEVLRHLRETSVAKAKASLFLEQSGFLEKQQNRKATANQQNSDKKQPKKNKKQASNNKHTKE